MQLGVDSKGSLMMEVDTYALQQLLYLSFVYRQDKAKVTQKFLFPSFIPFFDGRHLRVITCAQAIG